MAIRSLTATFTGINPVLQNNPQTVDRFNTYAKAMKAINDKGKRRTDDDYLEIKDIEVRSKIFWDDELGIYIPSNWVQEALACNAFKTVKVSKDNIRGGVFPIEPKNKLTYEGMASVKAPEDIVKNGKFRIDLTLPQGQVRIVKSFPIFHKWSFSCGLEYDDAIIDHTSMVKVLERASKYGGFGDFRPTFGRATVQVSD